MWRILISILLIIAFLTISNASLSCSRKVDNFVMHDLTVTPSKVAIGEEILIEFWMDNKGFRGVLTPMILKIDGKEVQIRRVRAEERATTRGFFRVTANVTGEHTIIISDPSGTDKLSGVFVVTEP